MVGWGAAALVQSFTACSIFQSDYIIVCVIKVTWMDNTDAHDPHTITDALDCRTWMIAWQHMHDLSDHPTKMLSICYTHKCIHDRVTGCWCACIYTARIN